MKRTRRLEIVVETEQRVTLRRFGPLTAERCEQCSGLMAFAEETVVVTGLSSDVLHRLVETGEVHFKETPAGAMLICSSSLRDIAGEGRVSSSELITPGGAV